MTTLTKNDSKALREGDVAPPALSPGSARIYGMRFCPFAERALLYAGAKGIHAEIVNIHLRSKPAWYFEKHPKGQVPTFEKDGKTVIESMIIPEYLDGIYPETAILPQDPYEKARQRIIAEQLGTLGLHDLLSALKGGASDEEKEQKLRKMEEVFDNAEKLMTGEYFGGSKPGYADWMTFPFFERHYIVFHAFPNSTIDVTAFPSFSRWPKLSAWWKNIYGHPVVKAVTLPVDVHLAYFKSYETGTPDFDLGL